ncbi:Uncharacterized SAM-binding protein YcdF, DUF218 family [Spirosomataceae bacterium TFI 002]|nr:Uncharacterized SAM-binding protein YcdF, DUF218 family [Spirosomataceae bacterium TFI 002]
MFFFFSKFLGFMVLPQGILLILGVLIYLNRKNHTKVKWLAIFSISLTYIFCSSFFLRQLGAFWEIPKLEINKVQKHDYAVLLTGGLVNEHDSNIQLGVSGDRLWKVLQLYQNKKIDQIIISGGDINPKKVNENSLAKEFLVQNGVPADSILQETEAVNTYENALFTSQMVKKQNLGKNGILVSSAYHLKRAQACFQKQGLDYLLYPASNMNYNAPWDIYVLLPQAKNFVISEYLIKEVVGYWVYKAKGYL